jgi:hypothetical protein
MLAFFMGLGVRANSVQNKLSRWRQSSFMARIQAMFGA